MDISLYQTQTQEVKTSEFGLLIHKVKTVLFQGWLQDVFNLHDSCGVHNLHGMPGIFSSLLSAFYCGLASKETYGDT